MRRYDEGLTAERSTLLSFLGWPRGTWVWLPVTPFSGQNAPGRHGETRALENAQSRVQTVNGAGAERTLGKLTTRLRKWVEKGAHAMAMGVIDIVVVPGYILIAF